jgi:hypothetical protein
MLSAISFQLSGTRVRVLKLRSRGEAAPLKADSQ